MVNAINPKNLEIERSLGEGQFGRVELARMKRIGGKPMMVAYKTLKTDVDRAQLNNNPGSLAEYEKFILEFNQEISVMQYLSCKQDGEETGCFSLIGAVVDKGLAMVIQFCNGGSVESAYKSRELSQMQVVKMIQDMSKACLFLAGRKIAHSDIACRNVLIDKSNGSTRYLLGDFGMAIVCVVIYFIMYKNILTIRISYIKFKPVGQNLF